MEYFDVYDENRNFLNKVMPKGTKLNDNQYKLVVHVCIFNSKNQMLIQQRQNIKSTYPNTWDISVGGHVITGETTKQAAHRETFEELGLDIDFENERPFFTINFTTGFDDFYIIEKDINLEDLSLQPEEVQAVKWASKKQILKLISSNKFMPYYKGFIHALFDMKEFRGVHKPK